MSVVVDVQSIIPSGNFLAAYEVGGTGHASHAIRSPSGETWVPGGPILADDAAVRRWFEQHAEGTTFMQANPRKPRKSRKQGRPKE